jgi:lysophospholipase L1-like esterase
MVSKRILIITDSLGAPRNDVEIITYDETWVGLITKYFQSQGHEVIGFTDNGLSSTMLLNYVKSKLTLYNPDIVVTQYGIVDCAPRVLKNREILLSKLFFLSKPVHYIAKKYHAPLSKLRNICLTPFPLFKENVEEIYALFKKNNKAEVVTIAIAPANDDYIKKSPQIQNKIEQYNTVLQFHCDKFIEYGDVGPTILFLPDAHHLNKKGHETLYQKLLTCF